MTITLTKTKAALAVVVLALLIPATAYAANNFTDVPAGKFYAEPVDWAFNNDITTGKTPTSFAPEDNVTRGETVTFLKRYNDNIVEPADQANADAAAAAQADADANASDIGTLQNDRSIVAFETEPDAVDNWDGSTETIDATLTAPSDGYAIVTYSAHLARDCDESGAGNVRITATMNADGSEIGETNDHINIDGAPNCLSAESYNDKTLSMTRVVAVSEGANAFDVEISHTGSATRMLYIYEQTLSATFVPIGQPSNDLIIFLPLSEDTADGQGD